MKKIEITELPTIEGSGGKGGGGGGNEANNTLRSSTKISLVEVLSAGPIVGPVSGMGDRMLESFYFNDTPIQNEDGTYNLNTDKILIEMLNGESSDASLPHFLEGEAITNVNKVVKSVSPTGAVELIDGGQQYDSIMVNILLPNGLFQVDDKGNINGSALNFTIEKKEATGGVWTVVHNIALNDKTMGAFDRDYQVTRPDYIGPTDDWLIRVKKVTADSTSTKIKNDLTFNYYVGKINQNIAYPNTAVFGVRIDAQVLGSIPTRSVDCYWQKLKLPTNYDGLNRKYNGGATWNGQFADQLQWSDNPAWVLYNTIINKDWGFGEWISEAQVDKASFFMAAQYCDGRVPIGDGTLAAPGIVKVEPRFSFNGEVTKAEQAIKLLNAMASTMRATVIEEGGLIKINQDRPADPVMVITNANVKDGNFEYAGTDVETRYTAANISYTSIDENFKPVIVHQEDATGIAMYGYNALSEVAFCCTGKGQALRHARWAIDTSLHQTESANWTMSFNGMGIQVGDVVRLLDNHYAGVDGGGRLVKASASTDILHLDRAITLTASTEIDIIHADGTMQTVKPDATSGVYSDVQLSLSTPLAQLAKAGCVFIARGNAPSRLFRIMTIANSGVKNEVNISAVAYDPNKFARVEQGLAYEPPVVSLPDDYTIARVTNVQFVQNKIKDQIAGDRINLEVTWDQHRDPSFMTYKYEWRKDGTNWSVPQYTNNNGFTIPNAVNGVYDVMVYAVNVRGVTSPATLTSYVLGYAGANTLYPPKDVRLQAKGGEKDLFRGKDIYIEWTPDGRNDDMANQIVGGYDVVISKFKAGVKTELGSYSIDKYATQFTYDYAENLRNGGPDRSVIVSVYTVDGFGNRSTNATTVMFSNPAPVAPDIKVTAGYESFWVDFVLPQKDNDFLGFKVFVGDDPDFVIQDTPVAEGGSRIYQGNSSTCSMNVEGGRTYFVKACAYDEFSEDISTLNISVEDHVAINEKFVENDYTFTGLKFKANDPGTNQVSWDAFDVISTAGNNLGGVWHVAAGNATWTSGVLRLYWQEGDTSITTSTDIVTATNAKGRILAAYKGGLNLSMGNGDVFIDGSTIYAGTVSASQLVADEAIIKHKAQMGEAVIGSAAIDSLAVNDGHIQNLKADKLLSGTIEVNQNIYSTNYALGSGGWVIKGNGNAEFNNVTVRGDVYANNGYFKGDITGSRGTFSGSLSANSITSPTITGGNITATNLTSTNITSATLYSSTISGGNINIGNGMFTVDQYGNCYAGSLTAQRANQLATGTTPQLWTDTLWPGENSSTGTSTYLTSSDGGGLGTFWINTGYTSYENIFNTYASGLLARVVGTQCQVRWYGGGPPANTNLFYVDTTVKVHFRVAHQMIGGAAPAMGQIWLEVDASLVPIVTNPSYGVALTYLSWSLLKTV